MFSINFKFLWEGILSSVSYLPVIGLIDIQKSGKTKIKGTTTKL